MRQHPIKHEGSPAGASPEGKLSLYKNYQARKGQRPLFANETDDPLAHAFDSKVAVHPGLGGEFVPKEIIGRIWGENVQRNRSGKTAAYFHIPVCETRCLFCGFYSNPLTAEFSRTYVDALINDMDRDCDAPFAASGPVHAVYLGGGTPTALDGGDLFRLLSGIRDHLPLANDCEITVEGRIHRFDEDKMKACVDAGANRFSIGVQTFDSDIRRRLGRIADRSSILASLENLMRLDQAAVVIDLIYGLPGQTLDIWREDLNILLALDLDGADLYQLNVFENGALDKAAKKGKLEAPPAIADQSTYFKMGVDAMTRGRYRRLSISHWGQGTRERNLYNLLFKGRSSALAYGAGAGGNIHGHFFFLEKELKRYLATVGQRKPVMAMVYPLENDPLVGALSGGLETGAVNLKKVGAQLDMDLEAIYQPVLDQWEKVGLIEHSDGWVNLTLAGQFWQVNLTQALIDYFDDFHQQDTRAE
jgi:oxygen-independent coproporphyrinogen-3 oxidase